MPIGGGRRSGIAVGWLVATIVVLVLAALIALQKFRQAQANTTAAAPPVVEVGPENIAVVQRGEVQTGPALSGTLTPERQATVRAEVSGPVLQTYVERGQPVKDGQLLMRIDATALRQSYLSAQSAASAAKLALENAQRDFARQQRLEQAGAVAPRDVESAQSALSAAQAQYSNAQAQLTAAGQQLGKTEVRAPMTGVVSDRPVNAGDVVTPGTALITIVDPSSLKLDGTVPADEVTALRVGQPVHFTVNGYPGRDFVGRISRINPVADPATRQVQVTVTIPNAKDATLVGGLFAQGRVATETHTGLLAPAAAVDERGVAPSVTRLAQGRAQHQVVQLGIRDPETGKVEITAGVQAGDTLLLGAAQGVTAGQRVQVVQTTEQAGRSQ